MNTLHSSIQKQLNTAPLSDQIGKLFAGTLNWGALSEAPRRVPLGVVAGTALTSRSVNAVPIAQLGGVPVFRVDWDEDKLPNVTARRQVQKELSKVSVQHLACYVTRHGQQAAFVWARPTGAKSGAARVELRTLPFETGAPARTTIERLGELAFTLDELGLYADPEPTVVADKLNRAFDVQKVTDDFFRDYRRVFENVRDAATAVPAGEKRQLWTQRLFNRLMFLYFLQKKGWLSFGGDTNYLRALFNATENGDFLNDRLYWAFFFGLNTDSGEKLTTDELLRLRGDVPYLNGGLFQEDGEFDKKGAVTLPNAVFAEILNLFESYNFTITESAPFDVMVAVDPEMLGKVFEELVTGRHESGSYYTPRGIVSFMAREALKTYLAAWEKNHEALRRFVDEDDATGLGNAEQILEALRCVQVCDPACGSGAYLLGMMQELLRLRESLFAAKSIDALDIFKKKREIIGRNLYGVDKDAFAVNIAMLRLWLSLVVDYDGARADLPPLPNLNYKIARGDSLSGPDPDARKLVLFAEAYSKDAAQLQKLHAEHFEHSNQRRLGKAVRPLKEINADIDATQKEIADTLGVSGGGVFDWRLQFAEVFAPRESVSTIAGAFNFGQELSYQPETGGFDIVLANPPYVRMELFKADKPLLKANFPHVHDERTDLYVYFYARAMELLRPGGAMAFITPNKWFRAGYGAKLRAFLAEQSRVLSITDFGELPVFQSATAYPMIFIAQKRDGEIIKAAPVWTEVKSLDEPYPDVRALLDSDGQTLPKNAINGKEWTLTDVRQASYLQKMCESGVPLKKYVEGKIFYGVKTGCNEAFIIDSATRASLIKESPACADVIKPLLIGRDVKKWHPKYCDRWLIYMRKGLATEGLSPILRHLEKFKDDLEKRATKQNWYELQQPQERYVNAFESPKIIYQEIATYQCFAYDAEKCFVNNKVFFIPVADLYLLGVLNSAAVWKYLNVTCPKMTGGALALQAIFTEQIPIPNATPAEKQTIAALVQKCLTAKGVGCEAWESEINEHVARLYGL